MLLAVVWTWWIGVVLTLVAVFAVVGLIASYVKSVTAQRYPIGKPRRHQDL